MTNEKVLNEALALTKRAVKLNNETNCAIDVEFSSVGEWAEFTIYNSKQIGSPYVFHETLDLNRESYDAAEKIESLHNAFDYIEKTGEYVEVTIIYPTTKQLQ